MSRMFFLAHEINLDVQTGLQVVEDLENFKFGSTEYVINKCDMIN